MSYARPGHNFGNLFQSFRSGLRPWSGLEALNTLKLWGLRIFTFAEFRVLPPGRGATLNTLKRVLTLRFGSCPTTARAVTLKTLKMVATETNSKVFSVWRPTPGRDTPLKTRKRRSPPPISKFSKWALCLGQGSKLSKLGNGGWCHRSGGCTSRRRVRMCSCFAGEPSTFTTK